MKTHLGREKGLLPRLEMSFANCVLFGLGGGGRGGEWGWVESQSKLMLGLLHSLVRELASGAVSMVKQPHCLLFDDSLTFMVFISDVQLSWKTLLC